MIVVAGVLIHVTCPRVCRRSLRPFGVGVQILEPGVFATDIISNSRVRENLQSSWDALPLETKESYAKFDLDKCRWNDLPCSQHSRHIYLFPRATTCIVLVLL